MTFDLALNTSHRASGLGYIATGGRALFPVVFWMLIDVAAVALAIVLARLLRVALSTAPAGRVVVRGLGRMVESSTAVVSAYSPARRAGFYTVFALIWVVVLVVLSWPLLATITQMMDSSVGAVIDTSVLGSRHETYQNVCTWAGATAMLVLLAGWLVTFRPFGGDSGVGPGLRLYSAAGLGIVVLAAVVTTGPWQLLWNNQSEPITYDGRHAFVVTEDADRLYLWVAEPPGGRSVVVESEDPRLDRSALGVQQRIFDDVE